MCHGFLHLSSLVCLMEIMSGGFCFSDRDFATSPPITSFSFSEKEKEGKRKTAQGVPPLGELHYFAAGRGGEIMNSRRLHPPRPPGNGCDRWRQRQRCCAQRKNFLYSGKSRLFSEPSGGFSDLRNHCITDFFICRPLFVPFLSPKSSVENYVRTKRTSQPSEGKAGHMLRHQHRVLFREAVIALAFAVLGEAAFFVKGDCREV